MSVEIPVTGPRPGDIVESPAGRKWRVIAVSHDIVRAKTVEEFNGRHVTSHLDATTLTIRERHPGGPR